MESKSKAAGGYCLAGFCFFARGLGVFLAGLGGGGRDSKSSSLESTSSSSSAYNGTSWVAALRLPLPPGVDLAGDALVGVVLGTCFAGRTRPTGVT